jgi:hypothetical protein
MCDVFDMHGFDNVINKLPHYKKELLITAYSLSYWYYGVI